MTGASAGALVAHWVLSVVKKRIFWDLLTNEAELINSSQTSWLPGNQSVRELVLSAFRIWAKTKCNFQQKQHTQKRKHIHRKHIHEANIGNADTQSTGAQKFLLLSQNTLLWRGKHRHCYSISQCLTQLIFHQWSGSSEHSFSSTLGTDQVLVQNTLPFC